jgi:sucrose-6-phosphate hydrolase SacC (GH32 family)
MNDPNGMVYLDGEYHLFFQYNPNDIVWGPMHWGHAISTDLVHWEELPIALYPDELGTIFSGSAVVDYRNTSGLQTGTVAPIIAIFTHAGATQQQSIAVSNDRGRSFQKYAGNPVIPNANIPDFRDPKVLEVNGNWVMVLAVGEKIDFYSSKDLKSWDKTSEFGERPHGGVWECPDLFPYSYNNDENIWVLIASAGGGGPNLGSGTQYFLG